MPVSLGLSITQNSQNSTAKTTNVTVALTLYWTGGSYNGYSKPGTVTIDGTPYDFTASFNYANGSGPVSTSGNAVVFTKTLNIAHNSDGTKTLYCSATYESGVSSGTVTTSNSKVLTPFSSSSGGNTGGDSGGSSGGDSGGSSGSGSSSDIVGDPSSYTARIRKVTPIGIGASLLSYELLAVTSSGIVPFGSEDYVYTGTTVRCCFYLPDGYEVIATYARYGTSISDSTETDVKHDRGADYCEFVMPHDDIDILFPIVGFSGDYYATDMTQRYSYRYNSSDWVDSGNHNYAFFLRENGSVTALRFTTPDFVGRFKKVRFGLAISAANVTGSLDARYALCSSDINCNNYVGAGASVVDETQIATGVTSISCNEYYRKNVPSTYSELTLDVELKPNTTYYLYLWDGYALAAAAKYHNIVFDVGEYAINISKGDHTGLTVRRNDTNATLSDGDTVPAGTAVSTYFWADSGYELNVSITNEDVDVSLGNWTFIVNANTTITTTATKIESDTYPVNIDTGSEFASHEIYIDNGSGWDKYAAYIDDGTSWHLYS